jgi:hypothetical protein
VLLDPEGTGYSPATPPADAEAGGVVALKMIRHADHATGPGR